MARGAIQQRTSSGSCLTAVPENDSFDATGLNLPVLAKGNGGNDRLVGGNKRDTLIGGAGMDILQGGADDDTLVTIDTRTDDTADGGSGRDTYWRDSVNGTTTRRPSTATTGTTESPRSQTGPTGR